MYAIKRPSSDWRATCRFDVSSGDGGGTCRWLGPQVEIRNCVHVHRLSLDNLIVCTWPNPRGSSDRVMRISRHLLPASFSGITAGRQPEDSRTLPQ
ncbi:hypothetical protein BAUCODRAFT_553788 [Baudoinia panamericana UAMH 10762]|uniref:Uncharacterized protein n=1 Tax=Baudoinia panamericana (strain UAMH 10762) TaxID=717646 RepID=M2N741_BAUPA|nr:uncharacterized protein BAUCODRAFT_553788 [Baudoinia panamericana UAMH 10762]EMC94600.1 hypothetical protein BAUCODRAFT_553788 [Baudoinia panamericana UAMH 10762]